MLTILATTDRTDTTVDHRWAGLLGPTNPQEEADILATDAVERDVADLTPRAEVQVLKDSGLVSLLGPAE